MRISLLLLAAPGLLLAQLPRVGLIEIYGLNKVSEKSVNTALGIHAGDPLPAAKAPIEDRLAKLPGVAHAWIEAFCCVQDQTVLYVGIEARESHHFELHAAPAKEITLSPYITNAYHQYLDAGPDTARTEARLRQLATVEFDDLQNVLRNAAEPGERATATAVIRYAKNERAAIAELQFAMQDSDGVVRSNAIRGLDSFIARAVADPQADFTVQPTWFIEMLNSIVWSERTHAATTLVELTENRDPVLLEHIRQRGVDSLAEMADWHVPEHAKPSFILLGRIAGLREDQIQQMWASGERKKVIERALKVKRVPGAPKEDISVPYWRTPETRP